MRITSGKPRKWLSACYLALAVFIGLPTESLGQQGPMLGYLTNANADQGRIADFRAALADLGYVEGKNITIISRGAQSATDYDIHAADFVRRKVDIIIGVNATATNAARKASNTVPIVMTAVNDPVQWGFAASLERPGKNVTGTTLYAPQLIGERLRILRQLVPELERVSMLLVPSNAANPRLFELLSAEAHRAGIKAQRLDVQQPDDIGVAFEQAKKWEAKAMLHAN